MTQYEKLYNYLMENATAEQLRMMALDVNSYDSSLDYLDYYSNDEDFFENFFHNNVMGAVRAVHFGDYNYNDEYIRFNAYGNLETADEFEYDAELEDSKKDIIENYIRLLEDNSVDNFFSDLDLEDDEEEE